MTTDSDRHVRPFAEFLHEQRGGQAHGELSEALNQLVEAVQETGKQGSVTLIVKVKPAGKGDHGTVLVSDTVTLKAPQPERAEAIFFADGDHNLSRHNPNQQQLPLREVKGRADAIDADAKEVAT